MNQKYQILNSGLRGVRGTDFSGTKIFVEESFGGKMFVRGERVEFSYFRGERFGEVDFMVVGLGRGNVVCSFFGEDRRGLGVFRRKDCFGLCSFCSSGKFCSRGEAGDYRGSHGDKVGTALDDLMEGFVFTSSIDVGGFFFPLVVLEEARIGDGIHVNVARGTSGGFEEGVVSFVIDFVGGKEEFRFIDRFIDGEGTGSPVDDRVGGS